MLRQVIALSVALFVALVASYVTWTDEGEELDDTEVAMYRAEPDDITSITWDSKKSTTTIVRSSDEFGEYFEVTSVTRKETKTPRAEVPDDEDEAEEGPEDSEAPEDAEAEASEADEDASEEDDADEDASEADEADEAEPAFDVTVEETERKFVGNNQTKDVWDSFAPLMALRELVVNEDTDTAVFALEDSETTITVLRGDKKLDLVVGAETYGSKDLYVGYADRVFLVDNKTLQPLEFAGQRLVERSLQPLAEREIASIELSWPDETTRTWTHEDRPTQSEAPNAPPVQVWSSTEAPDEADEAAATWINKLLRLRLREYLDTEEEQQLVLEPVFAAKLNDGEKDWAIEVFSATDDEGETQWYARTDHNRGTVLLTASLAREVTEDLGNLRP